MLPYSILGSLFLGSSLARIVSQFAISKFDINFFSSDFSAKIPSFSQELSVAKTFDIVDFVFFIIFSIFLFLINLLALRIFEKRKGSLASSRGRLLGLSYILFSFLIFLQAQFVDSSGFNTILLVGIVQIVYFILHAVGTKKSARINGFILANGFIAGFYLLLVANKLTTSIAIPLGLLIVTPFFYTLFKEKFARVVSSPFHLVLVFAAFFPFKPYYLLAIGILALVLGFLFRSAEIKSKRLKFLYAAVVVFIVSYNPLFYLGTFDSVEEGFWLGWLQRMLSGERLYLDVAVYHPPGIIWGLYIFSKLFGTSMYHFRLYMHLLQIVGIFIVYVIVDRLITKPIVKLLVMGLVISFVTIGVRNNVAIRLGMGLLALFPFYFYMQREKIYWLFLSGLLVSLSIFTSLEVGIASMITLTIGIIFLFRGSKDSVLKRLLLFLSGSFLGALPFVAILWQQGSLISSFQQLFFYANAFSKGYLNSPIDRPSHLTLLQWHVVNRYFSSTAWMWEMAKIGILSALMFSLYQLSRGRLSIKGRFVALLVIFELILFRSVLGRSDSYHLLSILIVSTLLIAYVAEKLSSKKKSIEVAILLLIALVFARGETQLGFMQNQLIKFQTYGNPSGSYPEYKTQRAKILTGVEVNTQATDDLIVFIQNQVAQEDKIFVYPWMPEIYFLSDRKNATSFDTPHAFFTDKYQRQMVNELESQRPKFVIYNPEMNFANLTPDSLPVVNKYINENFTLLTSFEDIQVLEPNTRIDRDI